VVFEAQEYIEAVLALVERIPPGRVMSYGAVADAVREHLGRGGPRQVGTVMAQHGGGVPWHRVVNSAGRLVPGHEMTARARLVAEGVPFLGNHVKMADAAWYPPDPGWYQPQE
jgi:methylated-DNA-protein-cysteine methyltransferase-like protein